MPLFFATDPYTRAYLRGSLSLQRVHSLCVYEHIGVNDGLPGATFLLLSGLCNFVPLLLSSIFFQKGREFRLKRKGRETV